MSEDIGDLAVSIGLDAQGFQAGMSQINRSLRNLDSGFRANSAALGNHGTAMQRAQLRATHLSTSMVSQQNKVDALNAAYQRSVTATGANSAASQQLLTRLNLARAGLSNMQNSLEATNRDILTQSSAWTRLGARMTVVGTTMKKVGKGMQNIGRTMTMSITAPIIAVGIATVKLASDVEESTNKVDVAFGSSSKVVKDFAETTLKSFGIAKGSALEMASLFGDMASGMGINTKQASEMSTKLVGLAGDLASFKNIGIDQAQTALKGIFTGEGESLKSLGIIMLDSTLAQFALEKGYKKTYKTMTQGERVMLRYQYVLDKSKNSQGDFARTSTGTANSMRIFQESLKELGATLGKQLLPIITPMIQKLSAMVKKFSEMSPKMQENIIKIAAITAVIGPALVAFGTLLTALGSIVGFLGTVSTALGITAGATGAAGLAAGTAAVPVAGFGVAIGAALLPVLAVVAALGSLIVIGLALKKHFSTELTPEVDLFATKIGETGQSVTGTYADMSKAATAETVVISKATKDAVGAYMDLDTKATGALTNLYVNSTKITNENSKTLIETFRAMSEKIVSTMDKQFNDQYNSMKLFFEKSNALSKTDEEKALAKFKADHEAKKKVQIEYEKQIEAIITNAKAKNRDLSIAEEKQIDGIKAKMGQTAIKVLSTTEKESKVILERLKAYGTRITAEQASAEIKNANKAKDGAIKAANDTFEKTKANFIKARDESHSITADQATKLIADADKQRRETIAKAEAMKKGVVSKITTMNKDINTSVNTSTGNILTKWDKLKTSWDNWTPKVKSFFSKFQTTVSQGKMDGNWTGNNNFQGGLTTMHEKGYEVYNLNKGSQILNHEASLDLVTKTAEKVAQKVADGASGSSGITLKIENFVNNRKQDIEALAEELQFYGNQKSYGR